MGDRNYNIERRESPAGIVAALYCPSDAEARASLVIVGGSGGGLAWSDDVARQLAGEGYRALALAYFRAPGLPKNLVRIPVEYVEGAIDWMKTEFGDPPQSIGLVGASRGAELMLLVASGLPRVGAVVAIAPSCVLWGADGGLWAHRRPAWTRRGRPLPWMRGPAFWRHPVTTLKAFRARLSATPWRWAPHLLRELKHSRAAQRAAIPVQRIRGPILLISGAEDQLWPSKPMGDMIVDRLTAASHPFPFQHLSFDGAGHAVSILTTESYPTTARHPVTRMVYDLGGDEETNRRASRMARQQAMQFLERAFAG